MSVRLWPSKDAVQWLVAALGLRDQGPTAITVQLGLADGTCTEIVKGDVHRAPLDEAHLILDYSRMPALRRSSNLGWMTVRVVRPRFVHVERI